MEVKINKEIRNYTESMFLDCPSDSSFFLSFLRRGGGFVFSSPSTVWYGNPQLGLYLRCVPLCGNGFIKYNGMTAEQFVWAWIKSEFLMPKKLMFLPDNLYYETMKPTIEAHEKRLPTVRKSRKAGHRNQRKRKRKKRNAARR